MITGVREEINSREKRERVFGPRKWSADSIVVSATVYSSSVWKYFRKLDTNADGQTGPECCQLRVCIVCLEEAKSNNKIDFIVEVD